MSTSYTDASIRMALLSLDKKIDKNTGEVRRHLRSNTEADVIKANGAALKEFSQLINRLEGLGQTIETLNKTFEGMENLVNKADNDTKSAVEETRGLIEQQNNTKIKQAILAAFKAKFVISESEAEILVSSSHPIDKQFFEILNKVKKIHADCDALLATDNQELGLEIMSKMSAYMDQAYDRLFFVVQKDLKTVKNDDQTSKKQLSQALKVLSERPAQFEVALKTLSESRQRSLTTLFVNALTTDTAHEKAIDFYAFDPLRYVGDILAWIHSEIVNERETVSSLFSDKSVNTYTPNHQIPLTELGHKQAKNAGQRLVDLLHKDDNVMFYTSPYKRTRETTEGIAQALEENGIQHKVYQEPRLREQDFGNFQGGALEMNRVWKERAHYGHFFYRIPNGESAADVYDRIAGFNETLFRQFTNDKFPNVLVLVAHGIWIRVFLMKWFRWTYEKFETFRNVRHCEFLIMEKHEEDNKYELLTPLRTWDDPEDTSYHEPVFARVLDETAFEKQAAKDKAIKEEFLEARNNPLPPQAPACFKRGV
ncbi:hypothetical protein D0Z00_001319 [Geotrichum galactomycetum]|uniref:Uncharacterized protein n=1 Tax=Geotrichum galactomycetum TaxID=27317 RepID=A0ACB6V7D3_9ASCO|nr:hypothetical protein D0Z00_001319 [Geotrichum candidum]